VPGKGHAGSMYTLHCCTQGTRASSSSGSEGVLEPVPKMLRNSRSVSPAGPGPENRKVSVLTTIHAACDMG
jgi:hypothetical protein